MNDCRHAKLETNSVVDKIFKDAATSSFVVLKIKVWCAKCSFVHEFKRTLKLP